MGTPWGYITQKKKTEEAQSDVYVLRLENEKLKKLLRKLISKQELTPSEKIFLDTL